MKLNINPARFRRFPSEVVSYYEQTVGAGGEAGALDDARWPIKIGIVTIGLFFGAFGVWAALTPLSAAAVAPGVVTVSGNRLSIQPVHGGVVTEVLVQEGQAVAAGQELIRLNGVATGARLAKAEARRMAMLAAHARLAAERDGRDIVAFPAELTGRSHEPIIMEAMRNQSALFETRLAVAHAERRIIEGRITSSKAERDGARRQLTLMEDELADTQRLYDRGFAPRSRLRSLQRARIDLQTVLASTGAEAAEAELQSARQEAERARVAVDQLRAVQEQLAQVEPETAIMRQTVERDRVRAPFSGRVVDLQAIGPGSVIGAGQAVLDLLPSGRALVVEARVRPENADEVRVGSRPTVRLTSLNPHGRSSFDGRVTGVSADRLTDQTGQAYYLTTAAVYPHQLAGASIQLQAGVPATVRIATHERTFLDYLMGPVGDAFNGALREE